MRARDTQGHLDRGRSVQRYARWLGACVLLAWGGLVHAQAVCPGLVVTPATSTVVLPQTGTGPTITFTATYSVTSPASGQCTPPTDVTAQIQWSSSNPAVAAFQSPNSPNVITTLTAGYAGVTATWTQNPQVVGFASVNVSPAPLAGLPGLTPNQRSVAQALDTVCPRVAALYNSDNPPPPTTADFLAHCQGIASDPNATSRAAAVAALSPEHFSAFQSQALLFSQAHTANVLDRMMALRGGARGLSVADVTLSTAHGPVSLADLAGVLGGGASADAPGNELLADRLGIWLRGNYGDGSQDATTADSGFDGHQVTATAGIDYRVGSQSVLGLALGASRSGIGFRGVGGGIDTHGVNASVYGTSYLWRNLYLDAVLAYDHTSYATTRHIVYTESGTPVDVTAKGSTSGNAFNGTVNLGYDFALGALTVTPMIGYSHGHTLIHGFTESGAGGLDYALDDQTIDSSTAHAGLQMNLAWNLPFGVLLPHLRAQWVHEFDNTAPLLGMHFAVDPLGSGGTEIVVQGDMPNTSYWKRAGGAALQFTHGVAAYAEYQRLQNYGAARYADVTVGLRFQGHF